MHIVIIGGTTWTLIKFRKDLILSWIKKGYRVTAMAPFERENNYHQELQKIGVKFQGFPLNRAKISLLSDIKTVLWLRSYFKRTNPDKIFAYQIKPVIYSALSIFGLNIGHYSMISGLGLFFKNKTQFREKFLQLIITSLYKISLKKSKIVFFQNKDDARLFIKNKITRKGQTKIVNGSGINLNQYSFTPSKNTENRKINFLLMARMIKDKGIFEYVEAARGISTKYPNQASFFLLGPLDESPNAIKKSTLDQWNKEGFITYLGSTIDVHPHIIACDVFVLPSSYGEGVPHSILEAMAIGRPILTTDNVGCRETVKRGKNGLLVPPKNVKALENAMISLISNSNKLEGMGRFSRKIAELKFDVNTVNRRISFYMQ